MHASLFILSAAVALGQPATQTAPPGDVVIRDAIVTFVRGGEADVAAQESGVLMSVDAVEGKRVARGDLLGQIDDGPVVAQRAVALAEMEAAKSEAENDVNIRYADANKKVASAAYQMSRGANDRSPGAVTRIELHKLALEETSAALQLEQAKLKQIVAQHTANARAADVKAADVMIARRKINSTVDGVVVEVNRNPGEWVNPGDVLAHVVRLDRLRIEGYLTMNEAAHYQVSGKPITAKVTLLNGETEFTGVVTFASPVVQSGGRYLVMAEVDNRKVNGEWLLNPGMDVPEMTVHLGKATPRAAAEPRIKNPLPR